MEITVTRTNYLEWETLSEWKAVAINTKAIPCGSVEGKGIEPRRGKYALKKEENYSSVIKIYPVPEDEYLGFFTASSTAIKNFIKSYNRYWGRELQKYHKKIMDAYEKYRDEMIKYESKCGFRRFFSKKPQEPTFEAPPTPFNYKEPIIVKLSNGETLELNAEIVYANAVGLESKNNFSSIRFHIGLDVTWSRGCLLIGGEYIKRAINNTNSKYLDDIKENIIVHGFDYVDTLNKAKELSTFMCCVEKLIGRKASVKVIYKSSQNS